MAQNIGTKDRNRTTNSSTPTCDQVISENEPYSQVSALLSLFPAIVSMRVWMAEHASPITTPDST